jgi:hypothetical protein
MIGEEEAERLLSFLSSLSLSSSSGTTGVEKGRGNGNWKAGEKKAGSGDWNKTGER